MAEKQKKLTQEQIDAIKNYKNEIQTIANFVNMVRKRPGMYLGPIGNLGYINMVREIAQNCLDQIARADSPATMFKATFDELTKVIIHEDDGMGIPHGDMIRVFTSQHTSSHFEAKEYVFNAGLHGVGSKVVNAMSKKFLVRSYIFGEGHEISFTDGKLDSDKEKVLPKKECEGKQGTMVMFEPALDCLGEVTCTGLDVLNLYTTILPLYDIGVKIEYTYIDLNRQTHHYTLINDKGLYEYITCKMPILKEPIAISDISPRIKMDALFTFNSEGNSDVRCFANYCPTQSGTHLTGFQTGICNWFKKNANDFFFKNISNAKSNGKSSKKKQVQIEAADVSAGLCGVIHACHIEPNFTGQAKEKLSNEDVRGYVINQINKGLDEWAQKNPTELQKVFKFLKNLAEIRTHQESDKAKISTKYNSVVTGYPAKFTKPTGPKSQWEGVYFVEGDSAEGTAKFARIKACQGIMPLRGKIPNAFTKSREAILSNEECAGMLNVIGGGEGKKFDLSKVPWKIIASLTDADIDGAHIAVLFLIFMLVYCRPAVEEGLVYKAQPPLYGAKKGGKQLFFGSQVEITKYIQKDFLRNNTITDMNGNKLSHVELLGLLMKNDEYIYELERVANSIAVNPYLLETLLINRDLAPSKVAAQLKKNERFRFINTIKQVNNNLFVDGLVDKQSSTISLGEGIINQSSEVIARLDETMTEFKNAYFLLNGKPASLYQVMQAYDKYKPSNITRYKGLGEMDWKQLRESTMDPDGPRCLIQYTAKDIINEVEEMRYLSSNLQLIKLENKVRRADLLD